MDSPVEDGKSAMTICRHNICFCILIVCTDSEPVSTVAEEVSLRDTSQCQDVAELREMLTQRDEVKFNYDCCTFMSLK